jgi:hypothetical protein
VYQRIARDQADPDDGAQAALAYEELCKFLADHLDPNDLGEAEALIRQFVDQSGDNNIGTDEPPPFIGRPGGVLSMDEMHRRVAVSSQIRAARPRHSNSCSTSGSPTPPASGGSDGSDTHPARSAADHSRRPPPPGGHVAPVA